ncbi:MAG: nitrogenase component 1 [Lachnospiraceae bacterium]|nr:nitrogenase component 1 [Lachnospiraceae bacterium]
MLKRVGGPGTKEARIPIGRAAFPKPFIGQLEYNPPVHENWNIVHTGMLLPGSHQIYVCPDNCMRGVIMTADEMDAGNRFSCVLLTEKDVDRGKIDETTIEGVTHCIQELPKRPEAVLVFLVCLHHFMGVDTKRIFDILERRFPEICFLPCWMDPIMQKTGITPEQKERKAMLKPIKALEEESMVSVFGDNLPLSDESDIARLVKDSGYTLRQIQDCQTYQDYCQMGHARVLITRSFFGVWGLKQKAREMGRTMLYLPSSFSYAEIRRELDDLCQALGVEDIPEEVLKKEEASCEQALSELKEEIGDTEIAIDVLGHPRPLGLARLLLSHGMRVTCVYLDAISLEEEEDYHWLKENHPELILNSIIHVSMRKKEMREQSQQKVLAVGPKAAYYQDTPYYVNMIEGDGDWGYQGIRHLTKMMREAYRKPKDLKSIVPRKGLGCACVLQ